MSNNNPYTIKANQAIIQKMNDKDKLLQNEELTLTLLRNVEQIESQKSLAEKLGYSVGKINYVLKALIDKGFIKAENFATSTNKRKYRYLLTEKGIKEKIALTEQFIERKKREYEELQAELKEIGERA